jgi:hypothetical protein
MIPLVVVTMEGEDFLPLPNVVAYLRGIALDLRGYEQTQDDAMVIEKVADRIAASGRARSE